MTANVKILVNQRLNVLKVPNAALRYHPASTRRAALAARADARATAPEKAVWILDANDKPAARRDHHGRKRWHAIPR